MKLKKALSQRIKALREAAGLSQQDLAMRGDLSLSLVAKLEQGKKADPRLSTLLALTQALGVRPGQLLDDLLTAQAAQAEQTNGTPAVLPEPEVPVLVNGHGEASHGEGGDTVPPSEGKKAKKKKVGKKSKKE